MTTGSAIAMVGIIFAVIVLAAVACVVGAWIHFSKVSKEYQEDFLQRKRRYEAGIEKGGRRTDGHIV